MTMHLHHPSLNLNGKRKGKQKFASAEAKQKQLALQNEWEINQQKWAAMSKPITKRVVFKSTQLSPDIPTNRTANSHIPSLDTGVTGPVTIKQSQKYTGDKILGIGTMHKSNAVPIFSDEQAKDISKMRR
jgi:hypothetical protein